MYDVAKIQQELVPLWNSLNWVWALQVLTVLALHYRNIEYKKVYCT